MNVLDKIPGIVPESLNLNSKFKFKCHNKIKCFTKCCRGISITLTPYDITLGVASLMYKEGVDEKGFYFFVNEPHCLGFEEEKEWTVETWRKDQGVDIHDLLNASWTDMIVHKRSFPPNIKFTDKTKQLFFMACYDIDKFREFVFESTFLDRYAIESEIIDKIKKDEIALSEFGIKWLKSILFKRKDADNFQLNEEDANLTNAGADKIQNKQS